MDLKVLSHPFRICCLTTLTVQMRKDSVGPGSKEGHRSDPMYGPIHDQRRHFVGLEYEVALEKALAAMSKSKLLELVIVLFWMHDL